MTTRATIPSDIYLRGEAVSLTAMSAAAPKPRCKMVANSGRPFQGWGFNAIFDMSGCELPAEQRMPFLRQHEGSLIAGQSDRIAIRPDGALECDGDVYAETPSGAEVLNLSAKGFRWQASVGASPLAAGLEWVGAEEQKTVNGHVFSDGLVIRKWRLKEASFVALGADSDTSAIAAASGAIDIPLPPRNDRSTRMAEPTQAPEKKGATLAELKAAFPNDREFALDHFEAGSSLLEARAAFGEKAQADLTALRAQLAAKPVAQGRTPVPIALGAGAIQADAGDPSEAWTAEVKRHQTQQALPYSKAVTVAAKARPDLHASYLKHINGGRELPRKETTR